ncbi:hypothetical protein QOZ80_6AG0529040 [Eleusine coracana subsp. coracana]|nr:hypothetical protein QOZ80_6AG0529040 [Eleusine coracana subsp. coracana]
MENLVGNNEFLKDLLVAPPIHPGDNDPVRPPPKSILLDPFGYISPRANGSTARGLKTDGHAIQVTFWPVPPPRISCFTVHCPGLPEHRFSDYPTIVTTADDLVLLRVNLHPPGARLSDDKYEYFVYQAGNEQRPPPLHLVPVDPTFRFSDGEPALLRCRVRDTFFVAVLRRQLHELSDPDQFDLHLYESKTNTWTTKPPTHSSQRFDYNYSTKVIAIGGGDHGTVGWVDLWRGHPPLRRASGQPPLSLRRAVAAADRARQAAQGPAVVRPRHRRRRTAKTSSPWNDGILLTHKQNNSNGTI